MTKLKLKIMFAVIVALTGTLAAMPARACTGDSSTVVGNFTTGNPIDPEATPAWSAIGLELTNIAIHTVCTPTPGVQFEINVTELNAPPPNEVVRYFWQFTINGHEYWVQAKSSDISSVAMLPDDPEGHFTHAPAFRLRGQCALLVAVTNCRHLAWLDGAFDTANKQIRVLVPFGLAGAPGADFAPGSVIMPFAASGGSPGVSAALQAGVSNALVTEYMSQDEEYTIAP
jgi:hypothetical protein